MQTGDVIVLGYKKINMTSEQTVEDSLLDEDSKKFLKIQETNHQKSKV